MTSSMRQYFVAATVGLLFVVLFFSAGGATAGTITITRNAMTDKTRNVDTASGYADADLSVQFNGAATCTCTNPNIVYTWYFGDGTNANGASVSHTYGAAGAGNRSPHLHCHCNNCGADADAPNLSASVISGIQVSQIGDVANPNNNGRLCFDAVRTITASALPAGVNGSNLIDWLLNAGSAPQIVNTASGLRPAI